MKALVARIAAARAWRSLESELHRWEKAGHKPTFWWRDDDARSLSPPLERLIAIASEHWIPLLLAVVPNDQAQTLRPVLGQGVVQAAQHGVDHQDRSGGVGPRSEFHSLAQVGDVAQQLERGRRKLDGLPLELIYVPPWNTLTQNLLDAAPQAGFRAVSGFGAPVDRSGGLMRLDAHLDLMRWSPAPRFRGEARLLDLTRRRLMRLRKTCAWHEPSGLLTHHLDHDEPAWRFLTQFLQRLKGGGRTEWVSAGSLLNGLSS